MAYKRLWIALGLVRTVSFAVLEGVGVRVLKSAPPSRRRTEMRELETPRQ